MKERLKKYFSYKHSNSLNWETKDINCYVEN